MSKDDLSKSERHFWLCRGCGHWSQSLAKPEPHKRTLSADEVPDRLDWSETSRGSNPFTSFNWVISTAETASAYYAKFQHFHDGEDRPFVTTVTLHCAAGYERWIARPASAPTQRVGRLDLGDGLLGFVRKVAKEQGS